MAAHRKPRQRSLSGHTARTATTLALAGAATATAFDGAGHAAPDLTPAQVKAKVDKLYHEAEIATEKYNGAKEDAGETEKSVDELRDEAARRMEQLNSARGALGSAAAAQYRSGAVDPGVELALSSDPDQYLERAALAERAGHRQAADVAGVQKQLQQIEQLREEADGRLAELAARQAELKRHKKTVTTKLAEAQQLLNRLSTGERAGIFGDGTGGAFPASGPGGLEAFPDGSAAAPNSRASEAVSYAFRALGSPYVWGATGPNAFDCSGLTQAAYRSAGVSLPRTTYAQIDAGRRIPRAELLPGDLVFFYSSVSHVGIYVGNGRMIHAPNPSAPVRVAPIDELPFAGATRVA
ncbi:C40 family peptidase [Streptomyces sp. PSKA54]|uniref:C40 family peptidase n=1 Tax=Streptomyces himalayensis subsp. aureolus TaxID=2758039 RepID=A0A7W2CYS8_9ACTN|nr:C40 family peptidase [Streptomyces himalayensis]MBA4861476.1 C40 family peptidase [Streptomyces himalayensis subsp. aureolus]